MGPGHDSREGAPSPDRPLALGFVGREGLGARLKACGEALARPPSEPGVIVPRRMALIGLCALLAAALAFLSGFDARIALAMRQEPDGVRAFLAVATDAVLIVWYFYPALALALALLLVEPKGASTAMRRRLSRLAVMSAWFAASLGAASTITHVVKYALGRARPELLDSHGAASFQFLRLGSGFESFPSGHSTNAGVVAMAVAIWFPALRWPALLVGACMALTRLVVEAHYLSDVIVGFAVGTLTALALARVLALRGIVYRVEAGGRGWRGLLPHRPGATG